MLDIAPNAVARRISVLSHAACPAANMLISLNKPDTAQINSMGEASPGWLAPA